MLTSIVSICLFGIFNCDRLKVGQPLMRPRTTTRYILQV